MSNKAKLVINNNLANNQDEEDEIADKQDVLNYKGIFFKEETEQRYFEGGAHFQYKDLCRRLEKLFYTFSTDRRGETLYFNDKRETEQEKADKQSRNQKIALIPHNTQNLMNLSMNKTRNANNNNTLFLNNLVYSKKMENGAEQTKNLIEITMDNKKSRNNNDSGISKQNELLAKTNIYIKKSIETKPKVNNRDIKTNKNFELMRSQKPIISNNNNNHHSSISIKNIIAPRINSTSQKIKNPLANLTGTNINPNLTGGKKIVYVEKKEINLHKSNNTSKSNITSQHETSLTKSLITQSKQSTIKSASIAQDKSFKVQGIDMYKYISSLLQKKITTNQKDNSKSPMKRSEQTNPVHKKYDSVYINRASNGKKNQHISFEMNMNSNQKKLNDIFSSDKKSRNNANSLGKHNSDKTPSIKSISFYIQNKRQAAIKNERSQLKNIIEDKTIVNSNSKKKEKAIIENSFLKQTGNPLRNSKISHPHILQINGKDPVITSKNIIKLDKFLNGSGVANNSEHFFKKIDVRPRNVLIKPDNTIKERYLEVNKGNIRDKKNNSIKVISNSSVNISNSRVQSNSFIKPMNINSQKTGPSLLK